MSQSNMILSIYKSRVNILDIMDVLDYEIDEYRKFSINEIDAMTETSQLDLLLNHRTENKKVYIKYFTEMMEFAYDPHTWNLKYYNDYAKKGEVPYLFVSS